MAGKASRQAYINVENALKHFEEDIRKTTEQLKKQTDEMKTALNNDDNAVFMEGKISPFIKSMNEMARRAEEERKMWESRRKAIFKE